MKSLLPAISDYRKYRILEMIPGLAVWTTFVVVIILSFTAPLWAIYFILVFDLYWLLRIIYMILFILISYRRYRHALTVNWLSRVQALPGWEQYYHLIFYPTYKEPYQVLRDSFDALRRNEYPLDKCLVVLAGEESDRANFEQIAARLTRDYGPRFFKFLVTRHPRGLVGDLPGKGSNIAWAGHRAQELIDQLGILYSKVIVSSFDADTCVHPHYFSYLTYLYMTHPRPTHVSWQPLAIFNNNVWDSPAVTRVISYSTTFWLMSEQSRPERMFTFSSHSMSFQALVDVGFWQNDIVTEDSRIAMQCVMEYDGDYTVEPMYLPVSMDVVVGKTFWQTLKSQYIQQRRWAYGVENFPFMVWNFGRNRKIPFIKKFRYIFNQTEGVYSWATAPLLILILGWLPIWYISLQSNPPLISQTAPQILRWLMTAAMIGLVTQATLGVTLLPPKPKDAPRWRLLVMIIQWLLSPITLILFGSLPATEATTRLMLGKYLGFQVTKKVRK
jgi:cellulose synthase/poly-beta-1,6-N-acetylglucosamine synthase-like glycosyltransferase